MGKIFALLFFLFSTAVFSMHNFSYVKVLHRDNFYFIICSAHECTIYDPLKERTEKLSFDLKGEHLIYLFDYYLSSQAFIGLTENNKFYLFKLNNKTRRVKSAIKISLLSRDQDGFFHTLKEKIKQNKNLRSFLQPHNGINSHKNLKIQSSCYHNNQIHLHEIKYYINKDGDLFFHQKDSKNTFKMQINNRKDTKFNQLFIKGNYVLNQVFISTINHEFYRIAEHPYYINNLFYDLKLEPISHQLGSISEFFGDDVCFLIDREQQKITAFNSKSLKCTPLSDIFIEPGSWTPENHIIHSLPFRQRVKSFLLSLKFKKYKIPKYIIFEIIQIYLITKPISSF